MAEKKRELAERIEAYFASREGELCSAADLCAYLGITVEQLRALYDREKQGGAVRRAMTRIAAQLERDPRWMGSNASKSIFLLRQPLYGGYSDKGEGRGAKGEEKVVVEVRLKEED